MLRELDKAFKQKWCKLQKALEDNKKGGKEDKNKDTS